MAVLLAALIGAIIAAWWYYTRRLDWRLARITSQLRNCNKRSLTAIETKRILRQIYKIIHASLSAGNNNTAYRAFDLLKLAYGYGLGRQGEPVRLTAAVYLAVRSNQLDIAGHGIDAFRPLIKNMQAAEVPAAVEQLGIIAVMSLKKRQNFLAARAVDSLAVAMGVVADEAGHAAVMRSLRLIGLIALRRKDTGLILEMQTKMSTWLAAMSLTDAVYEQVAGVLSAWLHRAVKAGDAKLFEILTTYMYHLVEKGLLPNKAVAIIISDCNYLAGIDSLNPYSPLAGAISMASLDLALQVQNDCIWRQAVDGAGQAAKLAIAQRSLGESFAVVYPLFENGRRMLVAELNAGPLHDSFRQQALYVLLRECLQLIEFVARQNFVVSTADIIDQIYRDWIKHQKNIAHNKSIKKFCQFLFLYCTNIKRRQRRVTANEADFNIGEVITVDDRKQLERLGYLFF